MAEGPPGTRQINTGPWLYTNRGIKFCKKISGSFWGYITFRTTFYTFWDKKTLKFEFFSIFASKFKTHIQIFFPYIDKGAQELTSEKIRMSKTQFLEPQWLFFHPYLSTKNSSFFPQKNHRFSTLRGSWRHCSAKKCPKMLVWS